MPWLATAESCYAKGTPSRKRHVQRKSQQTQATTGAFSSDSLPEKEENSSFVLVLTQTGLAGELFCASPCLRLPPTTRNHLILGMSPQRQQSHGRCQGPARARGSSRQSGTWSASSSMRGSLPGHCRVKSAIRLLGKLRWFLERSADASSSSNRCMGN